MGILLSITPTSTINYKSPEENCIKVDEMKKLLFLSVIMILIVPFSDSVSSTEERISPPDISDLPSVYSYKLPENEMPWWETTSLDLDRNSIHDSLDRLIAKGAEQELDVYLVYENTPLAQEVAVLEDLGLNVAVIFLGLNAVGLKDVPIDKIPSLPEIEGVVMVEPKMEPIAFSDIATPNVKAKESEEYSPDTAWELGYTGEGAVIAIMDTGVDNAHPSLAGKWLAGADFSKREVPILNPWDGSHDADDTQGHGTTCAGIAMGTGAPEGTYQGTGPDARLVDLRIGTILGGSPGEGPQSTYDAALEATEWAIEHHADQWEGAPEEYYGIDALSLSWGIPYEGSSDGSDLYSQALNRLVDTGVVGVVAAGNDGPDNDGFTGMGAADKVITVAATDELDTINRSDDIIAEYSSRGPRWDDGDGNPYDELKPDVAAPGTGITNAEFDRWGDGSGNGYGPRGSGTSYATPNVVGVVAILLEVNPELPPDLVKEILRFTAERRENASLPELDPFWNRDFGWGIIDAHKAVEVAEGIEDVTEIDVNLQCFIMNVTYSSYGVGSISGIAWSKDGEVQSVEVRIDGGDWKEATDKSNGTWSKWIYDVEKEGLSKGDHTIEVRAVAGDKHSLHDEEMVIIRKTRDDVAFPSTCIPGIAILILVGGVAVYILLRKDKIVVV
jgi:serine protease AprX